MPVQLACSSKCRILNKNVGGWVTRKPPPPPLLLLLLLFAPPAASKAWRCRLPLVMTQMMSVK